MDWNFNNQYFMKFCKENNIENCNKKKCEYKIFCSRFKHLTIKNKKEVKK